MLSKNTCKRMNFFKVMIPGFQDKLNLPRAFCKKLKEEKPQGAILESRKGIWKMKACRNGEGVICLEDGWPQFVCNHDLNVGDFVVFEHIAQLHFNVSVFGPNNCEKDFLVGERKEAKNRTSLSKKIRNVQFAKKFLVGPKRERNEAEKPTSLSKRIRRKLDNNSVSSYRSKNPHFFKTMKYSHAKRNVQVQIPMEFLRSNDLRQKTSASLRDPNGNEWTVKLRVEKSGQCRYRMCAGWPDFYESNELKQGDVCIFDLNRMSPTSTIVSFDVKIFRS